MLSKIFHPTTTIFSSRDPKMVARLDSQRLNISTKLAAMRLRTAKLQIQSEPGVVLDGLIVLARGPLSQSRPTMVMVPGNAQVAEDLLLLAGQHANAYGCNVIIYNGRGVGRSTGNAERHIGEAVTDCKAAIKFACQNSSQVAVWGFSLGGGISAAALEALKKDPQVADRIKLYLNINSFGSLSKAAGSAVQNASSRWLKSGAKLLNKPVTMVTRGVMRAGKYDNLNTAKALARGPLAARTLVFSSPDDEMISGTAQLGAGLARQGAQAAEHNVTHVAGSGSHMAFDLTENKAYAQALQDWTAEAQRR